MLHQHLPAQGLRGSRPAAPPPRDDASAHTADPDATLDYREENRVQLVTHPKDSSPKYCLFARPP